MANLAKVLKDEIARLARKEARELSKAQQKQISKLRQDVSALKKQVAVLEKASGKIAKVAKVDIAPKEVAPGSEEELAKVRFTGKGIRSQRKKLGLSQGDYARLANVTLQSVYQWEKQDATLKLRTKAKTGLLSIRGIGRKEALKRLEELGEAEG